MTEKQKQIGVQTMKIRPTVKQFYEALEATGHVLVRDASGNVDAWQLDYDVHNGPKCVKCGQTWCQHCTIRSLRFDACNVTETKQLGA